MAEQSSIEWTDSTFNPWIGCTKISPACDHCYAAAMMDERYGRVKWGGPRVRTSPANWREPMKWQRQAPAFAAQHGRRRRVFCASLADVFDNQVPDEWRVDLWALITATPDLDWLLLTKRPQNIGKMLPQSWDAVKARVWLGTTVEDQRRAALNIPYLLDHDSAVRFISAEPLLGPLSIENYLRDYPIEGRHGRIDWVIAGGESGPHARQSHPDWFIGLRDQCAAFGVPFLFKQWGDLLPEMVGGEDPRSIGMPPDHVIWHRVGKKAAGRRLHGIEHNGVPA